MQNEETWQKMKRGERVVLHSEDLDSLDAFMKEHEEADTYFRYSASAYLGLSAYLTVFLDRTYFTSVGRKTPKWIRELQATVLSPEKPISTKGA